MAAASVEVEEEAKEAEIVAEAAEPEAPVAEAAVPEAPEIAVAENVEDEVAPEVVAKGAVHAVHAMLLAWSFPLAVFEVWH